MNEILFSLVQSALTEKPMKCTDITPMSDEQIHNIVKIAVRHDIAQLVVLGLKNNGLITENSEQQYHQLIYKAVHREVKIRYEFDKICAVLAKEKIPFIPLKGSVIRDYYPEPWMRMSCDIDILIHEEDLEHAVNALECNLDYKADDRVAYHDISLFAPSGVHLELHFNIKENMENIDRLLSDVWQNTVTPKQANEYCYSMTPEFFVFHHVCHMAHHFVHGGCGIKPFIDMYIINNRFEYNDALLREILRKCDMENFYDNVLYVTDVWFGEETHNYLSKQVEEYILKGGVYGSLENRVTVAQGQQGNKVKYAMSRIFLPYNSLKNYYPILNTKKWLFPFMQIVRWFRLIFCGGLDRGIHEMKINQTISADKASAAKIFLENIGL